MSDAEEAQARLAALLRAQGAVFIRELFRELGLAVSGSKSELEQRAYEALRTGGITAEGLRDWVGHVEGWGNQRVELRQLSDGQRAVLAALDEQALASALTGSGFEPVVGQADSDTFPDELTPTGAVIEAGRVRLTWHVRADRETRAAERDFEAEEDGDTLRYKAFRVVPERHTIRLVLQQATGVCSLFVSVPKKSEVDPDSTIAEAWELAERVAGSMPVVVNLDRAIRNLSEGGDPTIAARRRRMEAAGARVSFETTAAADYRDSPQVSQVAHSAAAVAGFSNRHGDFRHTAAGHLQAPEREVTVKIDQQDRSLWIPAQVGEEQMWNLVQLVVDASQA